MPQRRSALQLVLLSTLYAAACAQPRPVDTTQPTLVVGTAARSPSAALAGTWELVSTRMTRGDSVVLDATASTIQARKILNATHWAVVTRRGDQFLRAATGPYTLAGSDYTETVELASGRFTPGQTYTFRIELAGDTWTIDGGTGEQRFHEVWRRVR
jgi:hypothetical protein